MFVKRILNYFLLKFGFIDVKVLFLEEKPPEDELPSNTIVVIGGDNWAKWVFMKCPCGCKDVITLSLMKSYKPNWDLRMNKKGRITLSPSIWKKDGCKSHFFVKNSKFIWADIRRR